MKQRVRVHVILLCFLIIFAFFFFSYTDDYPCNRPEIIAKENQHPEQPSAGTISTPKAPLIGLIVVGVLIVIIICADSK